MPLEIVQVALGENAPEESVVRVIVSPTIEPNAPEIIAVQVDEIPTVTGFEHETEVVVTAWVTVTVAGVVVDFVTGVVALAWLPSSSRTVAVTMKGALRA